MMVLLIAVLVLVIGVVVAVVVGKVGSDTMAGPQRTDSFELPDGPIGLGQLDAISFDQSLRGYNMAQVDALLDRLRDDLRLREVGRDADGR